MKSNVPQQNSVTDINKQSKLQNGQQTPRVAPGAKAPVVKEPLAKDAVVKEPVATEPQLHQQQQAQPSVDVIKGKWQQQVGAAKIAWGKLTDDELLKSAGEHQKLSGLVQERYALTRSIADAQVTRFLADGRI